MAGVYFHIPFCKQACTYCDFHFSTRFSDYRNEIIETMQVELERRKEFLTDKAISSIYFGGGTPSLLHEHEVNELLNAVHQYFDIDRQAEITLEANPDDIDENKLIAWKKAGINRLSIGVQSFFDQDLKWMNRAHSSHEALLAIELAKNNGFEISIDIIYGLPHATVQDVLGNLKQLVSFDPAHISAYCLTVEEKTALHHQVKTNQITLPDDEHQASQFNQLVEFLKNAGYEQYEISNFAKKQKYAVHNSNYWKNEPYLGVGPSAHSYNQKVRTWNVANNRKYLTLISTNEVHYEVEKLSSKIIFNERVLTGLRTIWGVSLNELERFHPFPSFFLKQLERFKARDWLSIENDIITLTHKGKLFADHIASELMLVD